MSPFTNTHGHAHLVLRLPQATLPRMDLFPYVFWDALEIAFVVVALHLSMCKVFNRKLGTKTDNNQVRFGTVF